MTFHLRRFMTLGLLAPLFMLTACSAENTATPATTEKPAAAGPDPVAVVRHGPAWRYPQCGWIMLHVEGSPYERGFQHGRLLAAEIVDYVTALASERSPKAPANAWKDLRMFAQAYFLKKFDKEWLEEMKGIADGAAAAGAKFEGRRLDFVDVLTLNSDVEIAFLEAALEATANGFDSRKFDSPQYSPPRVRKPDRCSAFMATGPATRDGKIVAGHITMTEVFSARHYNVWIDLQPTDGHRVVFQTFPGGIQSGLDYYVSASGLIVCETTIEQTAFNPDGESLASRIRRVVQYAKSIDEAVEILSKSNNGLYTNEWLFGDVNTNEIAMFELGTKNTRLWRSSKNEWPGGTTGFYWGCNNVKDRAVLQDTVPDLQGKPANLVLRPQRRDVAWLKLFEKHRGQMDAEFGKVALTTPPLAAFTSCDAKVTTAEMAKNLNSWALFGPPAGRTWELNKEDAKSHPTAEPVVSNDWTVLRVDTPPVAFGGAKPVDVAPFPEDEDDSPLKFGQRHPFAWRGTLLPKTDADLWLAASFAEYEKVVSFERALKQESKDGTLSRAAADQADLALFTYEAAWYAAKQRGRADTLTATRPLVDQDHWYPIMVGQGVRLLHELRTAVGSEEFDEYLDEFGHARGGKEVTTAEFREFLEGKAGKPARETFDKWFEGTNAKEVDPPEGAWSIYAFEEEPQQALIVYGTTGDVAPQREAADLLQRQLMRRFNNVPITIKADRDVTNDDRRSYHLLLVGRPATNSVSDAAAQKMAPPYRVKFGPQSFVVRDETYAHEESSIIFAETNPWNSRFSVVFFAGLGADATRELVQAIPLDDGLTPQVILTPAGRDMQQFRVRPTAD